MLLSSNGAIGREKHGGIAFWGGLRIFAPDPCGNSSVGRARPCQGRGRGFESRFPLSDASRHFLSMLHALPSPSPMAGHFFARRLSFGRLWCGSVKLRVVSKRDPERLGN